ncbi:MAG TPA: hypothetical protein ENK75_03010 [Saprospiraceae bacterium]|nr:hypothetical protein [Saprospiraceae bacterium]
MAADLEWHIVVNPVAGSISFKKEVSQLLETMGNTLCIPSCNIWETAYKGHGIALTEKIIFLGGKKIISIGGDGTNHEVVNGILRQSIIPSNEITHAHFPAGSGNDWVKTMNIPTNIEDWLAMLKKEKTNLHNAGEITYHENNQLKTRYFVNVAGLAYDAFVVKYLEEEKIVKKSGGIYLMLIIKCLFKYKKQKALVVIDGHEYTDKFYTINIGVCKYSGGGMSLVPQANPFGDGLAVTLAGNISKLGVILNTWRFYNESILKHKKIRGFLGKRIKVESLNNNQIGIEADGEYLGQSPVSISFLPKVLRVVVP